MQIVSVKLATDLREIVTIIWEKSLYLLFPKFFFFSLNHINFYQTVKCFILHQCNDYGSFLP